MGADEAPAKTAPAPSAKTTAPRNEGAENIKASQQKDDLNNSSRLHPETASKNEARAKTSDAIGIEKTEHQFHLFKWINELDPTNVLIDPEGPHSNSTISPDTVAINMENDLREMDRFLRHQTGFADALAYKECPQHSRQDVYGLLTNGEREIQKLTEPDEARQVFERQVDLVNSAEAIFTFFLPPGFEGPTVERFWGAIYEGINVRIRPLLFAQSSLAFRCGHRSVMTRRMPIILGSREIHLALFSPTSHANSLNSPSPLEDQAIERAGEEAEERFALGLLSSPPGLVGHSILRKYSPMPTRLKGPQLKSLTTFLRPGYIFLWPWRFLRSRMPLRLRSMYKSMIDS